jgi:hypothetical protein
VTWHIDDPLGWEPCPACKRTVMFAWDADMEAIALDADDAGSIAVSLDGNNLPWCRDASGTQLAFDESLYRLHEPTCGLAEVRRIESAPSVRRRPVRPVPERKQASAR